MSILVMQVKLLEHMVRLMTYQHVFSPGLSFINHSSLPVLSFASNAVGFPQLSFVHVISEVLYFVTAVGRLLWKLSVMGGKYTDVWDFIFVFAQLIYCSIIYLRIVLWKESWWEWVQKKLINQNLCVPILMETFALSGKHCLLVHSLKQTLIILARCCFPL